MSIKFLDERTGSSVSFDDWISQFDLNRRTPILENIYDTIATEFSKIDLLLIRDTYEKTAEGEKHRYEVLRDHPNSKPLTLRPNMLQTKSELLYTIAYQLHAYRNALVRIVRSTETDKNIVLALEPIDCNDYLFGQGYEIGGTLYLKLKEKKTGKIILLDYGDTIHLRLNPNDIFYGDHNTGYDLTHFVKIFDENLSSLFKELKSNGKVNGIIEIGGSPISGNFNAALLNNPDKITKQQEVIERIEKSKGIIVLDSGEKWIELNRTFKTMSTDDINNLMKYLYNFKGINQAVIDGTASEAQMEVFFNKTIMPLIERLMEELNYKYLTQTARSQGQVIDYFKNPFEYMATKDMLSSLYLGAMFFTQNDVRRMAFKLPPVAGGDVLMDNKNFQKKYQNKLPGASTEGGELDDDEPEDS